MIFVSCNSCTSGSAQSPEDTIPQYQDVPITMPVDSNWSPYRDLLASTKQDTPKEIVLKKEIMKMEIDTTRSSKTDSMYKELEKTERGLKVQQKTLDSLIVIKKK